MKWGEEIAVSYNPRAKLQSRYTVVKWSTPYVFPWRSGPEKEKKLW